MPPPASASNGGAIVGGGKHGGVESAASTKEKVGHVERDPTLMTYNDQPYYAQPLRQDRLPKAEKIVSQRVPSEAT